ncbi:unnamed protein product [Rangifer tarandus platyrhynchus]|uniref:Uncharacterized protein n=1 Tax=Rangifer tarandus platyrhynchus TaxID=3082113 RepID=A0ABN8ZX56_RANTA|nr:unnamed protein product [Rangifer tarandus platyrhynchus]
MGVKGTRRVCDLTSGRGQAHLTGSGQCRIGRASRCPAQLALPGPVGLDVSGGPVAKHLPVAEIQLG